jgi:hypothetical protein
MEFGCFESCCNRSFRPGKKYQFLPWHHEGKGVSPSSKYIYACEINTILELDGLKALPEHGVTTVFVNLGNTKLELLHPLGENSPIANFLKKRPDGGIHVRVILRAIHFTL